MAQVNPNDVATAAIQDLQGAIDTLSRLKQQPAADIAAIDARIGDLQDRQDDLRTQALRTIEDSDANRAAIAAMNAAAGKLKTEAAAMTATAAALASVAQVVTAATSLISALTVFV
jgi:predicted  nucleic acid-binding Zn-ribbon protein